MRDLSIYLARRAGLIFCAGMALCCVLHCAEMKQAPFDPVASIDRILAVLDSIRCGEQLKEGDKQAVRAYLLFAKRNYAEAGKLFEDMLKAEGDQSRYRLMMDLCQMRSRPPKGPATVFWSGLGDLRKMSQEKAEGAHLALYYLGECRIEHPNVGTIGPEVYFRSALELKPDFAEAWLGLAVSEAKQAWSPEQLDRSIADLASFFRSCSPSEASLQTPLETALSRLDNHLQWMTEYQKKRGDESDSRRETGERNKEKK